MGWCARQKLVQRHAARATRCARQSSAASEHACWQPRAPSSAARALSIPSCRYRTVLGGSESSLAHPDRTRAGHNSRPHSTWRWRASSIAGLQSSTGRRRRAPAHLTSRVKCTAATLQAAMPTNGAADLTWRCLPRESSPLTSGMAFPSTMRGAVDGETLSWVYISSYLL